MIYKGSSQEYLQLEKVNDLNLAIQEEYNSSVLTILWFEQDNNILSIAFTNYLAL